MANEKLVNKSNLKAFRQAFQKSLEDGDITVAKSLITKQIENVSDERGSYQDKPFLFQATGTDSNTTETPTAPAAKHLELRGNTVVWNQLVDTNTTEIIPAVGHKYLTMINGVKSIIIPADDTPISVTGGTDMVIDLTNMFGAGREPTSVVQFNRLFPLPYYAYNAGELISCQSDKLVMVGYNQLEAQDEFIRVVASQTYRLMYWNGTALIALTSGSISEYDGSQTLIKTTAYDNLSDLHTVDNTYPDNGDEGIKLTDETQWVKIIGLSNTNVLFNLAWDGSRSDYEASVKHEYAIPNEELKSVGAAYDSHYPDGRKVQRIGILTAQTGAMGDMITIADMKSDTTNILCNLGELSEWGTISGNVITLTKALDNASIYYELATPIEITGQTFAENVEVDDFGTMWFTTSETESASNPIIPQGNRFFYPADYVLLIDDLNNYISGDVGALLKNTQIKAVGTALVPDANGNVDIPAAGNQQYGLIRQFFQGISGIGYFQGGIYLLGASSAGISARSSQYSEGYGGIVPSNLNTAVKAALTDANHLTMSSAEQATAKSVLGLDTLTGSNAPTSSTEGMLGQTYIDTTTNKMYICVNVNDSSSPTVYTWQSYYTQTETDSAIATAIASAITTTLNTAV